MAQKGKRPYETPSVKKLNIHEARSYLQQHGRVVLGLIAPLLEKCHPEQESARQRQEPKSREYEPPSVTKLTPEQAKLKLLGYFSLGDPGAKDLLDLLFPEPGATPTYRTQLEKNAAESEADAEL